ncbi:hypothetical protein ES703_74685 [subsurface metagenome]
MEKHLKKSTVVLGEFVYKCTLQTVTKDAVLSPLMFKRIGKKQKKAQLGFEGQKAWRTLSWKIFEADGFRCQYCGKTPNDGVKLTLDHVVPILFGGTSTFDNLITACEVCNLRSNYATFGVL